MLVSIEARQRRPNQSDLAMESMSTGDLSNMGSWAPKRPGFLQIVSQTYGHCKIEHSYRTLMKIANLNDAAKLIPNIAENYET